jgi:hypothetical protein
MAGVVVACTITSVVGSIGIREMHCTILTSRDTMQVDDDLEAMSFGPAHCFRQVGQLTLDVRLATRHIPCPKADLKGVSGRIHQAANDETYRQANVVQTCIRDGDEV